MTWRQTLHVWSRHSGVRHFWRSNMSFLFPPYFHEKEQERVEYLVFSQGRFLVVVLTLSTLRWFLWVLYLKSPLVRDGGFSGEKYCKLCSFLQFQHHAASYASAQSASLCFLGFYYYYLFNFFFFCCCKGSFTGDICLIHNWTSVFDFPWSQRRKGGTRSTTKIVLRVGWAWNSSVFPQGLSRSVIKRRLAQKMHRLHFTYWSCRVKAALVTNCSCKYECLVLWM